MPLRGATLPAIAGFIALLGGCTKAPWPSVIAAPVPPTRPKTVAPKTLPTVRFTDVSSMDPILTLGLGQADEVDSLSIIRLSGKATRLENLEAGRLYHIDEVSGLR